MILGQVGLHIATVSLEERGDCTVSKRVWLSGDRQERIDVSLRVYLGFRFFRAPVDKTGHFPSSFFPLFTVTGWKEAL